ncbi:MAG: substrate-binding domain-containing protein [Betaproteobacteria bacterium]|nr:substrate-binding domain-containing protein [Betaproteobacteria bacterium]MBV9360384.1 substrate-binding domain-containing protein [Betaproteobacteria bacterium]
MKLFLLLAALPIAVGAQELHVLSGGAAKSLVEPMAASFPGGEVDVQFQPMGKLFESLSQGANVDVVIVTQEMVSRLQAKPGARAIARVGIGVAVNEKAPSPDISTVEAFRKTLLAAKSIVYIDPKVGTSGKHVAEVLEKLGIASEVNAKAKLGSGGYIVEPVGKGEIELGIHQISEIMPVKGVKLVGELPRELQKYTVYVAVPIKASPAALAFIDHLTGPQARARLAQAGYTPPE